MSQPKIRADQLYTVNDPTVGSGPKIAVDEYQSFATGTASPPPTAFRSRSLSAFDAYSSTDFPDVCYSGITNSGPGTVRSFQLAVNWNNEEGPPLSMIIRANDDTADPAAWSAWQNVHLGQITFTTSATPPTGGNPGDVVYVY